ncbi:MAG: dihydroorotase [Planctomycetota bacterium]|jgi:dihydroorotase|uniref:dihydroorotase n=1 Tax=Patiriisocius sp. Uisw_047 TaxID=3230969 RepID=UPI0039EC91F8
MKILLKSATIVDPQGGLHLKKRDLLIENGTIIQIASKIDATEKMRVVEKDNLHVSLGWMDSSVSFGEPGYEERETIENGLNVAAASGFTDICINPNTNPVTDNKGAVQFLKSKAANHAVQVYPVGAMTKGATGDDLAELYDMQQEGARSFYDYKKPVKNANLLKIALQYCQNFNGLVQSFPMDAAIAHKGMVNEGVNSTQLGLKGIPMLAEELQITRDLYILEYTGGKLHIPTISTKKSVQLIKDAKKKGLDVTCSVAVHNLMLTDDALSSFDTRYKLMPPLRTKKEIKALLNGLQDGTIDGVTSDHAPIDIEYKKIEFDHAQYGSIGLESCFGALGNVLNLSEVITALTGLRERFGLETGEIKEGVKIPLTLFDPSPAWMFESDAILSTSVTSALVRQQMKGKVYGIISKNKLKLN